ncbi:MAG: agmatine deiminase family protein [Ignavibacteria bacterium]|nr:agmatine deiminase family protein [Ignavibacteria bacterium]
MKKLFLSLFALLLISAGSFAQNLPHYMTADEQTRMKNYIPYTSNTDDVNPPPSPLRTMAEWEECQGTIIAWTSFQSILRQIVDYAQEEGLVYIVCSDSNSVKTYLTSGGVPLVNLKFVIASFNSIWCRDYGPWAAYSNTADSLKLVDWIYNRPRPLDDAVPTAFANYIGVPLYQTTTAPNNLIHTGGNFMVDGNGTGFSSKLILNENPSLTEAQVDTIMRRYMGIKRYIKMETLPYDQIHHIDMHIKLLDEETLLVSQYPAGVADGPQIEANLQYILNNFQTCYGKPYKVVRIPAPPGPSGQYPNNGGDYRTYTNSLIINKTVIVPTYAQQYDTTALRIYRQSMPGYKIYGIDCNSIITQLGAIHCITKEIGVNEPVFISHSAIRDNSLTTTQQVKAYIKSKSGIASAKVYWTNDTLSGFSQIPMTASAGDTFTANIPAQIAPKTVYYYISASSNSGRTVTKPLTAPGGYNKFRVTPPVNVSNGSELPILFSLKQNYPNPFNPETVINYSIPKSEFVSLKVFDVNGKEVSSLVNSFQTEGNYSVTFYGGALSSGVYFYKLQAGSFSELKTMLLIK